MRYYLLFLLLLPLANAKLLYSGELYAGSTFKMQNEHYTVIGTRVVQSDFPNNYSEIAIYRLEFNERVGNPVVLRIGECKIIDYEQYCFPSIRYDFNNRNTTDAQGYLRPLIKLNINYLEAALKIDKTSTLNIPYNQTGEILVKIRNNGLKTIELSYREQIPHTLIVVQTENISVQDNMINTRISVARNTTQSFKYIIKNAAYEDKVWTGEYSYVYEGKSYTHNLTKTSVKTTMPFVITDKLSQTKSYDIDKSFEYSVQIKNVDTRERLKVNIRMNPGNLEVMHGTLDESQGYYVSEKFIPAENAMDFKVIVKPSRIGDYVINTTLTLGIHGFTFNRQLSKTYKLELKGVTGYFTSSKETLKPGDNVTIRIYVNNTNADESFKNIRGTYKGLEQLALDFGMIPTKDFLMKEFVYVVPSELFDKQNQTKLLLSFDGYYHTINDQEFRLFFSKNLTLNQSFLTWRNSTGKNITKNITKNLTNNNIIVNDTKNVTITKKNTTVRKVNTTVKITDVPEQKENKSWITSILDSFNRFIGRIFGKS